MQERVESDTNAPNNNKIIRPHAKPVDKEWVLNTLGNQATLLDDNTGGYDSHITSVSSVSQDTISTSEETREKMLHPHLGLTTATLSPN